MNIVLLIKNHLLRQNRPIQIPDLLHD